MSMVTKLAGAASTSGIRFTTLEAVAWPVSILVNVISAGGTPSMRQLIPSSSSSRDEATLIDLFLDSLAVDNGYFFITTRSRWDDPEIAAFRDWAETTLSD
tara:strand:- start:5797 stop:6099 length:303 start_codon:yes stop_codon:yes gene_type:complete